MNDNLTTNASNEAGNPDFLVGAVMPSADTLRFIIKEMENLKSSFDNCNDGDWWYMDKINERIIYYEECLLKLQS